MVTNRIADEGGERYDGATVALTVLVGAALAVRRVAPRTSLVVTVAGLAVYTLAEHAGGPVYLAPLMPLYTIAAQGDRARTYAWAAATLAAFARGGGARTRPRAHLIYLLAYAGWAGGAVFLGTTQFNRRAYLEQLEERARDLEESRDEEARRRVAEERLRIARDLHDVLAHGIATIHMHAAAALHVHRTPSRGGRAGAAGDQGGRASRRWTRCAARSTSSAPIERTPRRSRRRRPAAT